MFFSKKTEPTPFMIGDWCRRYFAAMTEGEREKLRLELQKPAPPISSDQLLLLHFIFKGVDEAVISSLDGKKPKAPFTFQDWERFVVLDPEVWGLYVTCASAAQDRVNCQT